MTAGTTTGRSSLVIGTRGSKLALWQAEWIQARLKAIAPDLSVTLRKIKTSGDKILDVPLAAIGGKGLFVKEIEEALLREEIDLAVHSMKDVPTVLPDGLEIICVPVREDPRDVLISREGQRLDGLPKGARVGTSSLRRQAQLLHHRPDLKVQMLRGNLDTRLRKVRDGEFDAIVLAAAGLTRMGWLSEVTEFLPYEISLPAIGQGALGLEGRRDDAFVRKLVSTLNHLPTRTAVMAERALLERLEGGCQVPIAAHATIADDILILDGLIASVDGQRLLRERIQGPSSEARALGVQLAERLLARGGDMILNDIYGKA
jgi:hydroxymethylbilane synthase